MWGTSFADLAKKAQEQAEHAVAAAASNMESPSITSSFTSAAGMFNLDTMQGGGDPQDGGKNNQATVTLQQQVPTVTMSSNMSLSTPAKGINPNSDQTVPLSPANLTSLTSGFTSSPMVTATQTSSRPNAKLLVPPKPSNGSSSKLVKKLQIPTKQPSDSSIPSPIIASKKSTLVVPKKSMNKPQNAPSKPSMPVIGTTTKPTQTKDNPKSDTVVSKADAEDPKDNNMEEKPISVDGIPRQSSDGQNDEGWNDDEDDIGDSELGMPTGSLLSTLDQGSADVGAAPAPTLDQFPPQKPSSSSPTDGPQRNPLPAPSLDQLDKPVQDAINSDPILKPVEPSLDLLPSQPDSANGTTGSSSVEGNSDNNNKAAVQEQQSGDNVAASIDLASAPAKIAESEPAKFETDTEAKTTPETSADQQSQENRSLDATEQPQSSAALDSTKASSNDSVSDHVLEQFSKQLERLEENHEAEKEQLQKDFRAELARQKQMWEQENIQSIQRAEKSVKEQVKGMMEREWARKRENFQLRIESLERELEGTQSLLESRDKSKVTTQDSHLNELRAMERQMMNVEEAYEKSKTKIKDLEKEIEDSNATISTKNEEYDVLKERVKAVAAELKERRTEVRTLQTESSQLKEANEELQDQITNLQAQGMDKDKSQSEVSHELNALRGSLIDKEKELDDLKTLMREKGQKAEEAMTTYKKKAQNSLSVANGRIASAVQAKEEAEMEARAARLSADKAMDRAVEAESGARQKMAEARLKVQEIEAQMGKLATLEKQLVEERAGTSNLKKEVMVLQTSKQTSDSKVTELSSKLQDVQGAKAELSKSLQEAEDRCNELLEEVNRLSQDASKLREDYKRVSAEKKALSEQHDTAANGYAVPSLASAATPPSGSGPSSSGNHIEAESTIALLRQELQDADQAIRELKQTLKATIEDRDQAKANSGSANSGGANSSNQPLHSSGGSASTNGTSGHSGSDSMPLFYAMEKQAELTQARNEISRLAGLVGDAQAEKQEAWDQANQIKEELHQLESQLQRMQQLGGGPSDDSILASSATSADAAKSGDSSDGRVNLEYLKNIVLSYLNAKTKQERKTLLPVIGTVLCLTPDEQLKVMKKLTEEDSSRVADAFANTMLTNFKWSKS